jgi:hypothetical protein
MKVHRYCIVCTTLRDSFHPLLSDKLFQNIICIHFFLLKDDGLRHLRTPSILSQAQLKSNLVRIPALSSCY